MIVLSRRIFLHTAGGFVFAATSGLSSYAFAIEPGFRLDVTSYQLTPPRWPRAVRLKAAIIADIHACEPLMPASRVRAIVDLANRAKPDIIFLLGDFNAGHNFVSAPVMPEQWGEAIAGLSAPLGTYAVLGNHDWWHGPLPSMRSDGGEAVRKALRNAGVNVLENAAVRLMMSNTAFWIAGLGDQMAHPAGHRGFEGADDLSGTLGQIKDEAPVILLAHEPYIFRKVPDRVSITLCGHTHGGQINLPLIGPAYARSRYGTDHIYGHIVEHGRHMIISAGLGTSYVPVRFMRPPELVFLALGDAPAPNFEQETSAAHRRTDKAAVSRLGQPIAG
ncbi:MAG: metallophosphoesterase [Beijerinckiaceae bacterium]